MAVALAMQVTGKFKIIEGNVLTLRPVLTITPEERDRALYILEEAIDEVERGRGY